MCTPSLKLTEHKLHWPKSSACGTGLLLAIFSVSLEHVYDLQLYQASKKSRESGFVACVAGSKCEMLPAIATRCSPIW